MICNISDMPNTYIAKRDYNAAVDAEAKRLSDAIDEEILKGHYAKEHKIWLY